MSSNKTTTKIEDIVTNFETEIQKPSFTEGIKEICQFILNIISCSSNVATAVSSVIAVSK